MLLLWYIEILQIEFNLVDILFFSLGAQTDDRCAASSVVDVENGDATFSLMMTDINIMVTD